MSETIGDWLSTREDGDGIDDRGERGPGCLFPGQCCMPGPHDKSECHTPEMIEDFEREHREDR